MARLNDLLPLVRSAAYGAPDGVLLNALRRAAQELCQGAQCWREQLEDVYIQTGVARYEFNAPFEANVQRVLWVRFDGRLVRTQMRPDELLAHTPTTGEPRAFAQDAQTQELLLWPTPTAAENNKVLQVCAALSPTLRTDELPDGIADEYGRGLAAWAKWDLLTNAPEMPWHNPQLGMAQERYATEIFTRAKRAQHSGHSVPLTVQPRRFV